MLRLVEFHSTVAEKSLKMSQQIRVQGGYLGFPISAKNTNFVEDAERLLPVKFRCILFTDCREKKTCQKITKLIELRQNLNSNVSCI